MQLLLAPRIELLAIYAYAAMLVGTLPTTPLTYRLRLRYYY